MIPKLEDSNPQEDWLKVALWMPPKLLSEIDELAKKWEVKRSTVVVSLLNILLCDDETR
jgi:hypothetical protein